jgi:hypothetical protein
VAETCDPSYSREEIGSIKFKAITGKKLARLHLNKKAGTCVATFAIPAMWETSGRIEVQAKMRTSISKIINA